VVAWSFVSDRFALPVSLDVSGRRCVILGGGPEATDKARRLVRAGAAVQVIAEEVEEPLEAMAAAGERARAMKVGPGSQEGVEMGPLVTPEARDRADEAHQLALANGAQICTIDVPDQCTFANPAVVDVGGLRLALSSGGTAPALLKKMKLDLERGLVTEEMIAFVRAMADLREQLPREERHRLREAVAGFRIDVQITYPAWFKGSTLAEEVDEEPVTERNIAAPEDLLTPGRGP